MQLDLRALASEWLIIHNHHACHLSCDPDNGVREDGECPRPDDVDDLVALLRRVVDNARVK